MGKKQKQPGNDQKKKKADEKTSHLSALMMLGSQLLSTGRFNEGLPPFITRGLDLEQIWQQLELRNEHKLSLPACTKEVVKISKREPLKSKDRVQRQKKLSNKKDSIADNDISENENKSDEESSEDEDMLNSIKKRLAEDPAKSKTDEFDDFSGSDEDELDFDFKVDNEIVKGLSDDEDGSEEEEGTLKSKVKKSRSQTQKLNQPVKKRKTVVDDKFFKMADMEQFLEAEDLKEEKRIKRESKNKDEAVDDDSDEEDEDDTDEEIDMFGELDSDDEAGRSAKYKDFFDPPDAETSHHEGNDNEDSLDEEGSNREDSDMEGENLEQEKEEKETEDMDNDDDSESDHESDEDDIDDDGIDEEEADEGKKGKKKVSFSGDLLESDEDDDDDDDDKTADKSKGNKSTFELRQEQLQAKAKEMEELSLKETPWELTGEATASKRPENSLLDTVLDFQHTTRAAPVVTDETTKTLEDYIKQRIKDKTFDDVERKEKPKEDVFEFKKRIVLDQEKSKQSLGELYEQEFLKQQREDTEEVKADPECERIEKDLNKLFHQLDALSNFRYTPMKPGTEVKIIVNTPAITMEEVAPVATADAELLAPEEVHEKVKGDLKANDERTTTDKKRARRQKKKEKRERKKAKESREKLVEKMKPGLGNKYSKAKALKQLEQLTKSDKNVTLIKGTTKKSKSSAAFFTELQEETQTNMKAKKAMREKKKKVSDAKKIML